MYGGPDGELGASLRYLSQRYSMPYPELKAILTDIGSEELNHLEMVGTIVYQLTRNLSEEEIKKSGFDNYRCLSCRRQWNALVCRYHSGNRRHHYRSS